MFKPNNDVPCHGCAERAINCHAGCGKYKTFAAAARKTNAERLAEKVREKTADDYLFRQIGKARNRKNSPDRKGG